MRSGSDTPPRLEVSYAKLTEDRALSDDVLATVVYGEDLPRSADPRILRVGLQPLAGSGLSEVWHGSGPVTLGRSGPIRYACDDGYLFGSMDLPEAEHGGLAQAAETAYRSLLQFHQCSKFAHVWRIWNVVTAINEGDGDEERYRLFCLGRARAFASMREASSHIGYPAATAIGRQGGEARLQVYWLAASVPGETLENPRQVSAYRYPRDYGPAAPSFSRAMLAPYPALLISGTASIVGHASVHGGDLESQIDETMRNLDVLLALAGERADFRSSKLGPGSLLKVYLRNRCDAAAVERRLREHVPGSVPLAIVAADICRSELLLEIEAVHHG
jgi:chorismate lyase/3-hydroxybenzoate synthase